LNQQIQNGQLELQRFQDQLTTGQQYLVPSEDPSSALNTIVLQTRLERQQQFKANIETDRSLLGATENALSSVSDVVNSAKSIVLQGFGSTVTEDERRGLAIEVTGLITTVLNSANTKLRGRFLFAGAETDFAPFALKVRRRSLLGKFATDRLAHRSWAADRRQPRWAIGFQCSDNR